SAANPKGGLPMFGPQILDIAIGLIFVYLLLALICTTASELLAGLFNRRSRNLFIGIRGLLEDEAVKDPGDPIGATAGAAQSPTEIIRENAATLQNLGLNPGWQDESRRGSTGSTRSSAYC